jgi:hypothetical protein
MHCLSVFVLVNALVLSSIAFVIPIPLIRLQVVNLTCLVLGCTIVHPSSAFGLLSAFPTQIASIGDQAIVVSTAKQIAPTPDDLVFAEVITLFLNRNTIS